MTIARDPYIRALEKIVVGAEPAACWVWSGSCDRQGYGRLNVGGTPVLAHKLLYVSWFGPVPDGLELDHFICQNRACAFPLHMEAVTHAENMRRARTYFCGNGHHRLTHERVGPDGRRDCMPCGRLRAARPKKETQPA